MLKTEQARPPEGVWTALDGTLWLERCAVSALAALLAFLVLVAVRLRVDYFDSYQNLLNSRALTSGAGGSFSILRGPLYPVLLLPVSLVGQVTGSPTVVMIMSHLLGVAALGLLLWTAVRLFRLHLQRPTAFTGVGLLAFNVLLIGNGPLAKEDLPGTLLLTAAFFFYLAAGIRGRQRLLLAAGLLIGAAVSTRYSLLPVPFIVIAGYEAIDLVLGGLNRERVRVLALKAAYLLVLPVAVIFAVPVVVYVAAHRSSLLHAPAQFVKDLLLLREVANAFKEDAIRNYRFVLEAVTWPVVLAALAGLAVCIWRRQRIASFYLLWFGTVFLLHTYAIVHKEARYLLPALPAIYWFVAVGLETIWRLAQSWRDRVRFAPAGAIVLIAALLAPAAGQAVTAVARFWDPVYSQDYERQVSGYAASLAGRWTITWVGPYYPLHPRDYVFDAQDPYTYVYHFYWHVVSFWTGRPVGIADLPASPAGDSSPALRISWTTIDSLHDGDVLIVNPEPAAYDTGSLPHRLSPLVVERLSIDRLTMRSPDEWISAGGGHIHATSLEEGWRIHGDGLPDRRYELYVSGPPGAESSLTPVTVQAGRFTTELGSPPAIEVMALIAYDSARSFTPP